MCILIVTLFLLLLLHIPTHTHNHSFPLLLTAHHSGAIGAANSVRVVAIRCQALLLSGKGKSVGAGLDDGLAVDALVVVVAVLLVREHRPLVVLAQLLRIRTGAGLAESCTGGGKREKEKKK